jgi:hypothetical protein
LAHHPVVLDWRDHPLCLAAGVCRICGRPAWCRDENGRCCHKVCAEQATDRTDTSPAPLQELI